MNNTDKIIQTLLEKNKDSGSSGSGASADVVTSETLENELKAQQARIEKTFKEELKKLQEHFNNLSKEKEKENNGKENNGSIKGSNGKQKAEIPDDSGAEDDSGERDE